MSNGFGFNLNSLVCSREGQLNGNQYREAALSQLIPHISLHKDLSKTDLSQGCLFCLSFHPQKNLLAAARANCVQLWDPFTGELKSNLECHNEVVTTVEWIDSSETQFYTSSLDKTIKLWDKNQNVQELTQHNDWIRSLCVSKSNRTLLSGCVSAGICGWDINTGDQIFSLKDAHIHPSFPELNTINSLHFASGSDDVFASGARDGCIKLWDKRTNLNAGAVQTIIAHDKKVNVALFTRDNTRILSAGRDNTIRMWDMRTYGDCTNSLCGKIETTPKVLQAYNQHRCEGYNVSTCFMGNEKYILTGSEDNIAYIYETSTGKVVKTLEGHSNVVHLLHTQDDHTIATSSIDNCVIHLWRPNMAKDAVTKLTQTRQNLESHEVLETLLQKYGDQILRIFHKHNITLSSSWNSVGSSSVEDAELQEIVLNITSDLEQSLMERNANNRTTERSQQNRDSHPPNNENSGDDKFFKQ